MNIKIAYDWLLDYLDTDADPYEIQKYLSLCGPSVEKVEKIDNDYIFEIEITSNRIDSASVFGIAQECSAILPQFGKKARLKIDPTTMYKFDSIKKTALEKKLKVKIKETNLCHRFTALVLKNTQIKKSPDFINRRLNHSDIKSINNVVDISNYLMIALGQPVHIFDYDKIKNQTMIVRQSKKGERITTLDGKELILPGDDIVIEDGGGELIDLCGIMGGLNSSISEKTENILLFVQNYNKEKIRRTSLLTGQRTVAAGYFEKNLDEERVENTLVYGVKLLTKYAGVAIASPIYDLYPYRTKPQLIKINQSDIDNLIGVQIDQKQIASILQHLGFNIEIDKQSSVLNYKICVPSFRKNDIQIKEDVIEEIARIYGYNNIPSVIQKTDLPRKDENTEKIIACERKIKNLLKNWGFNEMYNYSMISEQEIKKLDLDIDAHLKIKNTISADTEYMRTSLIPSLLKNIHDNQSFINACAFFELAHVYEKKDNELPNEIKTLAIAVNADFFDLKGMVESLFDELNIDHLFFTPVAKIPFLSKIKQAQIGDIGWIGELTQYYQVKHEIEKPVCLALLNLEKLITYIKPFASYAPINPYAVITLDLTISQKEGNYAQKILNNIKNIKPHDASIQKRVEVKDAYQNKLTLHFYFSSSERNITLEEAKKELARIKESVKE